MKTDSTVDLKRQLEAYAIASSPARNPQSRWGKWPIYAAATGAAIAGASAASADIIYSGPLNLSGSSVVIVPELNHTIGFIADSPTLRHFVSSTTSLGRHIPSANLREQVAFVGVGNFVGGATNAGFIQSGSFAKNFPAGARIAGSTIFRGSHDKLAFVEEFQTHQGHRSSSGVGVQNNFPNHGFLGIELVQTNGFGVPTGAVDPGWVQVQFNSNPLPGSFDVTGWAYSTDGPINAGQTSATPEPSYLPLMLLAAGAAGVLAWKRSRKRQAQSV
jgi:hypothetical protein